MKENDKFQPKAFVEQILYRCSVSKGAAANLRRADNPGTEQYSWGILANLGVNLERKEQYLPCALVAASLARLQAPEGGRASDGKADLGEALAACYPRQQEGKQDGDEKSPANARLHRLLTCTQLEELCQVLRPMLRLIADKSSMALNHTRLLQDLLIFSRYGDDIKRRWAQKFYHRSYTGKEGPLPASEANAATEFVPEGKGDA